MDTTNKTTDPAEPRWLFPLSCVLTTFVVVAAIYLVGA